MRLLPNRLAGTVLGVVFLLVGVLAVIAGWSAQDASVTVLGIFSVNPLHIVVNVLIGTILIAGAVFGEGPAGLANLMVGVGLLTMGIAGFFMVAADANVLDLHAADHVLHVASALVLLGVALWPVIETAATAGDRAAARHPR